MNEKDLKLTVKQRRSLDWYCHHLDDRRDERMPAKHVKKRFVGPLFEEDGDE